MPQALEILTGTATAPSSTLTSVTMASTDSLTIRNAAQATTPIKLLSAWGLWNAAGIVEIRSPKLHDNVHGIRLRSIASQASLLLPPRFPQTLYPQDILTVQITGSATAGQIESISLLLWYQDLPGISGRFMTPEDVAKRMVNVFTVEVAITAGTGGGYTGSKAINGSFDLMQANVDYALLGYLTDTEQATFTIKAADTGNLRVGGPGTTKIPHQTSAWFSRLSRETGYPLIPVINMSNKAGVFIETVNSQAAASPNWIGIFAQLRAA